MKLIVLFANLISNLKGNYWELKTNRVALFQQIAQAQGFDPLIPENWYHVTYLFFHYNRVLFFSFHFLNFVLFIYFCEKTNCIFREPSTL
jgi:hypothetical protein